MNARHLASILVNNYNYGRFLREAIDSALNQTYSHVEVIVVDDGSTDNSREIIAEYGNSIVPVLKENGGQASAFNAGYLASHGDILFFLDSDDALLPTAVEKAVGLFDSTEVAKVHWPLLEVDEYGRKTGKVIPNRELDEGNLCETVILSGPTGYAWPPTSGNAWSRRFIEAIFPIPVEEYKISADVYLSALAPVYGRMQRSLRPLGFYRRHGRNQYLGNISEERLKGDLQRWEHSFRIVANVLEGRGVNVDQEIWKTNSWFHRFCRAMQEIRTVTPPHTTFILADEDQLEMGVEVAGRHCVPFLEHDGQYWGPPADDETGIRELERLREAGAGFMVFAWPAFWWLDYYQGLHQHLRSKYRCVLENDRLVVFDLRSDVDSRI